MGSGRETIQFVTSSSVRSDVVARLGTGGRATGELLEALDASSSAIYNALGELAENGLIVESEGGWELTGSGRIVADVVRQRDRCEALLDGQTDYLDTHDASVLPRPARLRIGALADGEVLSATETEPHRVVREVTDRLDRADSARVVSPIYVESYETAMPDISDSKLIVDERIAQSALESGTAGEAFENVTIRVVDVDFALGVTDSEVLLSLPTLDGNYDPQSELVAESERAREWGEDLFDRYWSRALTFEEFARRHAQ